MVPVTNRLRLLLAAIGTWRWRRDVLVLSDDLAERVQRLCSALAMPVPRVRISRRVTEAVAVGLRRPMMLLPAAWVTELPLDMLEAVIAHELAHLRRLDLWINLWQPIVETLLTGPLPTPRVVVRIVRRAHKLSLPALAEGVRADGLHRLSGCEWAWAPAGDGTLEIILR